MTKRSGPSRAAAGAGAGSGVAEKLRLFEYSVSFSFAMRNSKRLLAGASGYSFKEWKGEFYPQDMKPDAMLAWYAGRLPTVEINNTFYRMPAAAVLENWARTTPEGFCFAIKASRRITHLARLKADTAADSVSYLYRVLAALGDKRGPVLFQLPPQLKKDLPRLSAFLKLLPENHRAAFEFRNPSWFDDEVYAALRAAGAALCLSERENDAPRRWSRPRPGATCAFASRPTPRKNCGHGRRRSRRAAGRRRSFTSCTSRPLRRMLER